MQQVHIFCWEAREGRSDVRALYGQQGPYHVEFRLGCRNSFLRPYMLAALMHFETCFINLSLFAVCTMSMSQLASGVLLNAAAETRSGMQPLPGAQVHSNGKE